MITVDDLNNPVADQNLLYHYTKTQTAIECILEHMEIRFTAPKNSHDPLEFLDNAHGASWIDTGDKKKSQRLIAQLLKKGKEINRIRKHIVKILCFSVDIDYRDADTPDRLFHKGFCRSRMWSQYAEGHKGICLVFNKKLLIQQLQGSFDIFTNNVDYNNHISRILNPLSTIDEQNRHTAAKDIVLENKEAYFFTKLNDYRDEQEFRICVYSEEKADQEHITEFFGDSLQAIILGCKFPKAYELNIKQFSECHNIPVFQLSWHSGSPDIRAKNEFSYHGCANDRPE